MKSIIFSIFILVTLSNPLAHGVWAGVNPCEKVDAEADSRMKDLNSCIGEIRAKGTNQKAALSCAEELRSAERAQRLFHDCNVNQAGVWN